MRDKAIFASILGALALVAVLAHFSNEPAQSHDQLAGMKLQDAAHGISEDQRSEANKNLNVAVSEAASQ